MIISTASGLQVLSMGAPERGLASLHVWVRAGSGLEAAEQWGAAHAVEHLVVRGALQRASMHAVVARGGELSASTHRELVRFSLCVGVESGAAAAEALLEAVFQPSWQGWDEERRVIAAELRARAADRAWSRWESMCGQLWRGTRFERTALGDEASLARLGVDALRAFHARHYRPHRALAVLAGIDDLTACGVARALAASEEAGSEPCPSAWQARASDAVIAEGEAVAGAPDVLLARDDAPERDAVVDVSVEVLRQRGVKVAIDSLASLELHRLFLAGRGTAPEGASGRRELARARLSPLSRPERDALATLGARCWRQRLLRAERIDDAAADAAASFWRHGREPALEQYAAALARLTAGDVDTHLDALRSASCADAPASVRSFVPPDQTAAYPRSPAAPSDCGPAPAPTRRGGSGPGAAPLRLPRSARSAPESGARFAALAVIWPREAEASGAAPRTEREAARRHAQRHWPAFGAHVARVDDRDIEGFVVDVPSDRRAALVAAVAQLGAPLPAPREVARGPRAPARARPSAPPASVSLAEQALDFILDRSPAGDAAPAVREVSERGVAPDAARSDGPGRAPARLGVACAGALSDAELNAAGALRALARLAGTGPQARGGRAERRRLVQRPPASGPAEVLLANRGLELAHPDRVALHVGSALLDGARGRLHRRLRERAQLAYFSKAYAKEYLDGGVLIAHAVTDADLAERVLGLLEEETRRLAEARVTPGELDAARERVVNAFRRRCQTAAARAHVLAIYAVAEGADVSLEGYVERVRAVSAERLRDVWAARLDCPRELGLIALPEAARPTRSRTEGAPDVIEASSPV